MEIQDGFIVGIDNYCDRWCETCAFTSRCRLFADCAEMEAKLDASLEEIVDAPLLPQDVLPTPPPWMQEMIDEMNKPASEPISEKAVEKLDRDIAPQHESIEARAMAYGDRVHNWLELREFNAMYSPNDPRSVIQWFQYSIGAKTHRALRGLADDDPDDRDSPADHDGSAKVTLLGIERSHAAWLQLLDTDLATPAEVEPLIADLIWLTDELDRVFPRARAFIRPAFDEPDEVARLLLAEEGGA